nr:disease resistance protein RPP13-like isoform X6 [Ipomoea batatas]
MLTAKSRNPEFIIPQKPIDDCDLKHWKASSHNFPKLEHLYLRDFLKLREIPNDFAEISTLKSIELCECLPSAVESAKKIQDEQRDYGNSDMVVIDKDTLLDIELKAKRNIIVLKIDEASQTVVVEKLGSHEEETLDRSIDHVQFANSMPANECCSSDQNLQILKIIYCTDILISSLHIDCLRERILLEDDTCSAEEEEG